MRVAGCVVLMIAVNAAMGEAACFRTAREAAAETGVRDGMGFRLEGVRVDALRGANWATVRSCLHPEQPGQVLAVASRAVAAVPAGALRPAILVEANHEVTVVQVDGLVRTELAGIAQESGAAGERVHVRVGVAGQERLVEGWVRAAGLVELGVAR